jgi:hypothetical protein
MIELDSYDGQPKKCHMEVVKNRKAETLLRMDPKSGAYTNGIEGAWT